MGIVLRYQPSGPLAPDVKTALIAEARRLEGARSWWCEPMAFFESPMHGFTGRNKISLPSYSSSDGSVVEVQDAENGLMAWRDANAIAEALAAWSQTRPSATVQC